MILKQVNYKGLVVYPYQIKNNNCYYFINGKTIDYPYRLAEIPEHSVGGESLFVPSETVSVSEETNNVTFTSLYLYSVDGDNLIIKA